MPGGRNTGKQSMGPIDTLPASVGGVRERSKAEEGGSHHQYVWWTTPDYPSAETEVVSSLVVATLSSMSSVFQETNECRGKIATKQNNSRLPSIMRWLKHGFFIFSLIYSSPSIGSSGNLVHPATTAISRSASAIRK